MALCYFLKYKLIKNVFFLSMFLLVYGLHTLAQDDTKSNVTNQIWIDFTPTYKINDKVKLSFKTGFKSVSPIAWYKYYTSPQLTYSMRKWVFKKLKYNEKLYAGIEYYYINNTTQANVMQLSPYQGYSLLWPNRERLVIKHDFRLKERFQWETDNWNSSFGLQLSYEGSLTLLFQGDVWEFAKGYYLTISFKFYWNLIEAALLNDVTRITPGIGYIFNSKWKTAFLLGYNYTRNGLNDEFNTNNIIYRFRVYYSFSKKDYKNEKAKL